ncbi:MAG: cyclic pyranopterin monophosphate synthase MoaC [Gemmatimonadota bacterium]
MRERDAGRLTHVDAQGRAGMVDVGGKAVTRREASASGRLLLRPETARAVRENTLAKGDVLAVARIAGVQGAKETSRLIPLCHPLRLDHIQVEAGVEDDPPSIRIAATARASGRTGVEMEALTAVTVALLAAYDMVKAVDRQAAIGDVRLDRKSGGKSGDWVRGRTSPRPRPAARRRAHGRKPVQGGAA